MAEGVPALESLKKPIRTLNSLKVVSKEFNSHLSSGRLPLGRFNKAAKGAVDEVGQAYKVVADAGNDKIFADHADYDTNLEEKIKFLLPKANLLSVDQQERLLYVASARPDLTVEAAKNSTKFDEGTYATHRCFLLDEIVENEGGDWEPIVISLAGKESSERRRILGYIDPDLGRQLASAEVRYVSLEEHPEKKSLNAGSDKYTELDNSRKALVKARDLQPRTRGLAD